MNRLSKYILFIITCYLLVGGLAWGVKANVWAVFDLAVTRGVQSFHPLVWDAIMKSVSWIGYPPQTFWITSLIFIVLVITLGWKNGLVAQIMSSGAYLTGNFFKFIVDRSRPENFDIIPWQQGLEGGRRSFPAGHVEIFTALGLTVATIVWRRYPTIWGRVAVGIIVVYLLLLGISRIYLGEHWFTDVLAGYLVGLAWLGLYMLLFPNHGAKNTQQP